MNINIHQTTDLSPKIDPGEGKGKEKVRMLFKEKFPDCNCFTMVSVFMNEQSLIDIRDQADEILNGER